VLQVKFRRDSRQRLSSVFASGHADAAIEGDDLVCAAASAILQAAELGLTVYSNLQQSAVTRKAGEDASMAFAIPAEAREREDVRAIVRTAELAIEQLARQYPDNVRYVREIEPTA